MIGYESEFDSSSEALMSPDYEIPIDWDKYKKLTKDKHCGNCKRELEGWELNVNIANYYNPHARVKKKGRIKFICFRCACEAM